MGPWSLRPWAKEGVPRPEAGKRGMARPEAWKMGMARLKPWKRGMARLEPWEGGVTGNKQRKKGYSVRLEHFSKNKR